MTYAVRVGVALSRPPREDASVWVLVAADSPHAATLLAAQLAATNPRVVMPVSTEVVGVTL